MPDATLESEVLSYEYEFPLSRPCFRPSVPCLIILITECSSDDSATVSVNCGIALSCVGVCFPDPDTACAPLSGSTDETTHPTRTWSFTGNLSRNNRRVGRRLVHDARHSGDARHVAHRVHHGHAVHHHGHAIHHHRLLHARHTRHTRHARHTRHTRHAGHAIHNHIPVRVVHQTGLHHRLHHLTLVLPMTLATHRYIVPTVHHTITRVELPTTHNHRLHHHLIYSSLRPNTIYPPSQSGPLRSACLPVPSSARHSSSAELAAVSPVALAAASAAARSATGSACTTAAFAAGTPSPPACCEGSSSHGAALSVTGASNRLRRGIISCVFVSLSLSWCFSSASTRVSFFPAWSR